MPPLEVSTRVQYINKHARILVTKGGSYPTNSQGVMRKHQEKIGVTKEIVPTYWISKLSSKNYKAKFKWSNLEEEGSCPSSSAKVMAKNAFVISLNLTPI
jgi:hypothetical protein